MTTTNQNNEQLLKLCNKGNQRAQLEIYNRYYKAMYNTAKRIIKDSYMAEDVMQESFLTAFSKLDTLNDLNVFGSWLKRIVVNNSIATYHKINKEHTVALDDVIYKVEDDSIGKEAATGENVSYILNTINAMRPNYSLGLTLHLIEGYDYEEISEIMNISYANSRTLISRAKESLRKKLRIMA